MWQRFYIIFLASGILFALLPGKKTHDSTFCSQLGVAIRWAVNYVAAAISVTMNKAPKGSDTTKKVAQFDILVLIFPLALFLVTNVACAQVCMCFHVSRMIFFNSSPCCGQERMFCDWF
jgi:hypothetical protein